MRLVDYAALIGAIVTIAATIASGKTYVDARVDKHDTKVRHELDAIESEVTQRLKVLCKNQQIQTRWLAAEFGHDVPERTCGD